MAIGFYDNEGRLLQIHDTIESIFGGNAVDDRVNGWYLRSNQIGSHTYVTLGAGRKNIYPSEQGELFKLGGGYVKSKDLLSRGWYVVAPLAIYIAEGMLEAWNGNSWIECGLPLASIALVGIARHLQSKNYFPEKLEV